MRKLIFFMHTSLDGFVAGVNGEMDWIKFDDDLFDFVATMTDQADTATYAFVMVFPQAASFRSIQR